MYSGIFVKSSLNYSPDPRLKRRALLTIWTSQYPGICVYAVFAWLRGPGKKFSPIVRNQNNSIRLSSDCVQTQVERRQDCGTQLDWWAEWYSHVEQLPTQWRGLADSQQKCNKTFLCRCTTAFTMVGFKRTMNFERTLVWSEVTSVCDGLIRGQTCLGRSDQKQFWAQSQSGQWSNWS